MILNILFVIIVCLLFYRLFFKRNTESYQNPFQNDTAPLIDKLQLTYTTPFYVSDINENSLAASQANIDYININNATILKLMDDDNYRYESNLPNSKVFNFFEQKISDQNGSQCINSDLSLKTCDNTNDQKWSLISNQIVNKNTNKCLSLVNNVLSMVTCSNTDSNNLWITDTNNKIHHVDNYGYCLERNNNNLAYSSCLSANEYQKWYT
jgi:hypothetical protein